MATKLRNCVKTGYSNLLQTFLSPQKHTAILGGIQRNNDQGQKNSLHVSMPKSYPSAPAIPLPRNMTQIFGNETGRFTHERARDITGPVLIYQTNALTRSATCAFDGFNICESMIEPHRSNLYTDSYDCNGAVSLNSSMQSNVPQPFSSEGKSTHLNMPGGQWSRDDKYIADDMQKSHYARIKVQFHGLENKKGADGNIIARSRLAQNLYYPTQTQISRYSTTSGTPTNESPKASNEPTSNVNDSSVTKLKRAFKDYGSTVVVFHVGISLTSLGICYLAISSGVDVPSLVNYLGFADNEKIQSVLSNSSTFLIAFAVHKLFAPVRISITLATTPFLVRYLRKAGILKVK